MPLRFLATVVIVATVVPSEARISARDTSDRTPAPAKKANFRSKERGVFAKRRRKTPASSVRRANPRGEKGVDGDPDATTIGIRAKELKNAASKTYEFNFDNRRISAAKVGARKQDGSGWRGVRTSIAELSVF